MRFGWFLVAVCSVSAGVAVVLSTSPRAVGSTAQTVRIDTSEPSNRRVLEGVGPLPEDHAARLVQIDRASRDHPDVAIGFRVDERERVEAWGLAKGGGSLLSIRWSPERREPIVVVQLEVATSGRPLTRSRPGTLRRVGLGQQPGPEQLPPNGRDGDARLETYRIDLTHDDLRTDGRPFRIGLFQGTRRTAPLEFDPREIAAFVEAFRPPTLTIDRDRWESIRWGRQR